MSLAHRISNGTVHRSEPGSILVDSTKLRKERNFHSDNNAIWSASSRGRDDLQENVLVDLRNPEIWRPETATGLAILTSRGYTPLSMPYTIHDAVQTRSIVGNLWHLVGFYEHSTPVHNLILFFHGRTHDFEHY